MILVKNIFVFLFSLNSESLNERIKFDIRLEKTNPGKIKLSKLKYIKRITTITGIYDLLRKRIDHLKKSFLYCWYLWTSSKYFSDKSNKDTKKPKNKSQKIMEQKINDIGNNILDRFIERKIYLFLVNLFSSSFWIEVENSFL